MVNVLSIVAAGWVTLMVILSFVLSATKPNVFVFVVVTSVVMQVKMFKNVKPSMRILVILATPVTIERLMCEVEFWEVF